MTQRGRIDSSGQDKALLSIFNLKCDGYNAKLSRFVDNIVIFSSVEVDIVQLFREKERRGEEKKQKSLMTSNLTHK